MYAPPHRSAVDDGVPAPRVVAELNTDQEDFLDLVVPRQLPALRLIFERWILPLNGDAGAVSRS